MEKILLYHNPGWGKSRGALEILRSTDGEFDVIEYLKKPLNKTELSNIVDLLPDDPGELVRKDKNFKELGLDAEHFQTKSAVVNLLVEHPKLMQRPIIIRGKKAVIGRPSEKVEELL